jgi:hypothetical protein
MTASTGPTPARGGAGAWTGAGPELAVGAVLVLALTVAAWAWAGIGASVTVLAAAAILALSLMRLLPAAPWQPEAEDEQWVEAGQTSISGFWRRRATLKDATESMAVFEAQLRPTLQHLLAARLAERHGISLYTEPEAARGVLLAGGRDQRLWYWLDPRRPPVPGDGRGIPPRTLAAIIHRLEHL